MNKLMLLALFAIILGNVGCGNLSKPFVVPEENSDLMIEKPEPKPMRLPPAKTNVDAEEINDANYQKQASELDAEMKTERRIVSPAR